MKLARSVLAVGVLGSFALASTSSAADDKAACVDASLQGQTLRNAHKLLEARDQFRACAGQQCPAVVQTDCAAWLDAVEKSLPSVVVTAKDGKGADRADTKVTVDGVLLVTHLDGQAVSLDPGMHVFHFELGDGTSLDQSVLVREGEQNQRVAVVLTRSIVAPPPTLPSGPAPGRSSSEGTSGWRTVGWVLGGLGLAGLGVSAGFGVVAIQDKNNAHCDANGLCDPGTSGSIKSAALVSDVGLLAGGFLLAGGAALVLLAPRGGHDAATPAIAVAPAPAANGGGVVVAGKW